MFFAHSGNGTYSGWGRTTADDPLGNSTSHTSSPNILQKSEEKFVLSGCAAAEKDQYVKSGDVLCTQSTSTGGQTFCLGDGGAPLYCTVGGKKYLCGIEEPYRIRKNVSCADPNGQPYNYFWKLGRQYDWIKQTLGEQKEDELA